uniref:Uncharacterized protein n=1 Tax=Corethron hystrix TaxID=216773 RepID=A0A7S1FRA7_9STRA
MPHYLSPKAFASSSALAASSLSSFVSPFCSASHSSWLHTARPAGTPPPFCWEGWATLTVKVLPRSSAPSMLYIASDASSCLYRYDVECNTHPEEVMTVVYEKKKA